MAQDKEPHYFSVDLLQEGLSFTVIQNILVIPHLRIIMGYLKSRSALWLESLRRICSLKRRQRDLRVQSECKDHHNASGACCISLFFTFSGLYSGNETEWILHRLWS